MKLRNFILLILTLTVTGSLFAQKPAPTTVPVPSPTPAAVKMPTVTEILAKYVDAIGGRANNERPRTKSSKGNAKRQRGA